MNSDSYNRMLRIKNLRWEFGTVLPEEIKYNLCEQEVKEVKNNMVLTVLYKILGWCVIHQ